ncbi:MAG: hypothetical protein NC131_17140, partial [Roseburia sp.]|nr:hypothetical protein [Roseburia sp.]
ICIFAFRNGKPVCGCLRQDFVHAKKERNEEEIIISNQPIIFNITYTPWKIKSNATEKDRAKFAQERPYYEMSDRGNSIYKYMTADRKLNGENSKSETRSLIEYFQKSTGVFNGDGVITQEQLADIQRRAHAEKNIWHGFISLNKELSYKIDSPEKCMRLVKRTFGEFFRDMGLDPKYVDLMCSLHKDTPHHLHIHFWFSEKEPKCVYRTKKRPEYLHKGKISKAVIDKMHVRLNLYIAEPQEKLYMSRNEALRALKKMSAVRDIISKDDVKEAVLELARAIPKNASFHYGSKDMIPYREQIDRAVKKILLYDKTARQANLRFYTELETLRQKVNGVINGNGENTNHYKIDPKNITLIEEIENDYKRRQGNIVLQAVKNIKSETFVTHIKHKVNDKNLKRRLAISHRKVGKLFDGLIASFGGESELLERDFTNRLQEIEKEMQEEREAQEQQSNTQPTSTSKKWDWGK